MSPACLAVSTCQVSTCPGRIAEGLARLFHSQLKGSSWTQLHGFPKDKATLRQWVHFVRVRRAHFSMTSVTANTKICSAHFKEEDYDEEDARMVSLGLKTERLAKLIPTTEPSAQHLSACRYHTERHQESRDATMLIDAAQQETADSVRPRTVSTCAGEPEAQDGQRGDTDPNFPPLTSPEQTDDEDDPSVISDSSWVPGGHMSEDEEELCEEEPSHTCDPHQNGIDKFIVCQEVLMSLFALCPACCEKSDSLCIMWLPTFLAKPANAPQEHEVTYGRRTLLSLLYDTPDLLLQKEHLPDTLGEGRDREFGDWLSVFCGGGQLIGMNICHFDGAVIFVVTRDTQLVKLETILDKLEHLVTLNWAFASKTCKTFESLPGKGQCQLCKLGRMRKSY
ncbi:hypothetical protein N1851_000425 [Merluccius polli]|uniref:THAP domain-containing protein 1 n=1 Tax=Merluccius polli TaxID=89951 RepID=A0AA47NC27_MERPO|nr:hypothetical protein N1851_000425 [Merluccius polli]